jgi:hypothetical protein
MTPDIKLLHRKLDYIADMIFASSIKNDRVVNELYLKYYGLMRETGKLMSNG